MDSGRDAVTHASNVMKSSSDVAPTNFFVNVNSSCRRAGSHGMLLRTASLRDVGLFDPDFLMYYEDIDLCLRLPDAGWKVLCEPRAIIWHEMADGARAGNSEPWRWQCKVSSIGHLHRKRFSRGKAAFLTLATITAEVLSLLRHGHPRAAWHLCSSLAWGLDDRRGADSRLPSTRSTASGDV